MKTLTEREAAGALRCSVACLRRMRRESRGPRWTKIGRLVRYSDQWLNEYLEANSNHEANAPSKVKRANPQSRTRGREQGELE
jgi:hypothetical protein